MRFCLPLIVAGLVMAGCAKFPSAGATTGATRLSFRFTLRGPVNPNYIYVVAIRVLNPPVGSDPNLSDESFGPVPVGNTSTDSGSKNGFVGGLPTHYVVYSEGSPELYRVFRFPTQQEAPDPSDPNTPLNLAPPGKLIGDVIATTGVDPRPTNPGGDYGNRLGFDIDTSYLAQGWPANLKPSDIQYIQFNILATNKVSTSGTSGRVYDALGDTRGVLGTPVLRGFRKINVKTGGTYTNALSSPESQEPDVPDTAGGDDPSVDIADWSLDVRPQ